MARITGLYITCIARANDVYYEGVRNVDTTTEFLDLTYPTSITCSLLIFLQKEWSGKKFRRELGILAVLIGLVALCLISISFNVYYCLKARTRQNVKAVSCGAVHSPSS